MEMSDDYQDIGTPGGGAAMANLPLPHHGHTPDSPLSHQEEDSDPDLQDEESGEELLAQPRETNTHTSTDKTSTPIGTPVPLYDRMNFLSQTNDMEMLNNKSGLEALQAAMGSGFTLPFPFPPPTAFLAPQHRTNNNNIQTSSSGGTTKSSSYPTFTSGTNNIIPSSASSHSSESSQGSGKISEARDSSGQQQNNNNAHQQSSWSFEEQFKQVRQLYEINDDPKRKEFLDDLFSYMQKRGTPINRLPIMAKSVLDLYELYNLVIARGGLVDVINKKLWQEIIKGLHLPSSITSAAFTLRTQYMKYLYPYECEKRRLSTPAELQAAIDGNRREGRRSSYGAYGGGGGDSMIQRNPHTSNPLALHAQMSPLSLVTGVGGQHQSLVNGSAAHTPLSHHSHHPQHPQGSLGQPSTGLIPGLVPAEFEARMVEYVKLLNKELRNAGAGTPPPMIYRQGSATSPSGTPPRDSALSNALEMSKFTLWNMYNNNTYPGIGQQPPLSPQAHSPHPQASSPEPQSEALDLGRRSSSVSSSPARHSPPSSSGSIQVKRDHDLTGAPGLQNLKRSFSDDEGLLEKNNMPSVGGGTHIKISNRGDGRNGDNSLVVSMEINGIMYEGVLFAQSEGRTTNPANNNNNTKTQRSLVSQ